MLITEGEVEPAGVRAIELLLADRVCGSAVYLASTGSTNSRALADLSAAGSQSPEAWEAAGLPRLYLADAQTGGRGRRGRSWLSSDQSLTFSLLIGSAPPPRQRQPALAPLAAGLGVARAIEFRFAPLRAWLKWPNDVYLDGGKVAGVLLETHQNAAGLLVVGVGVNAGAAPEIPAGDAVVAPKSIAQCAGQSVPRYSILADIVTGVAESLEEADREPGVILEDFRQRCALTGREVSFQIAGRRHHGRCVGITDTGELAVETSSGVQYCHSGEVSLVRG